MKLTNILLILPSLAIAGSIPQCLTEEDFSYPTRKRFSAAAREFCHQAIGPAPENLYHVRTGYKRIFYDIEAFNSKPSKPVNRAFSFEIGMRGDEFPGQVISTQECIDAFAKKIEGNTKQYKSCLVRSIGEELELVRDWESKLHREGFADVFFQAFSGY